ncbi:ABC transporter permease [Anaerosporobacter faecicola]|uniref:ABC transporter permease n=1 Tax=Anaerosporobacter faecicola TaxID=2718714 RepID=UPI001438718B|nr:ABC transporter permease [Anaerosporobacter faecicola]
MKIIVLNLKRNMRGIFNIVLFFIPILAVILYTLIFQLSQEQSDSKKAFAECKLGIVDLDQTEFTKEMTAYLEDKYTISEIKQEIAHQYLIKNKVNYIVTFQKGLTSHVYAGMEPVGIEITGLQTSGILTFLEKDMNGYLDRYVVAGKITENQEEYEKFLDTIETKAVSLIVDSFQEKEDTSDGNAQYIFWGFVIFFMIYYNCYFCNKLFEDKVHGLVVRASNTNYTYGKYLLSLIAGEFLLSILQILIIGGFLAGFSSTYTISEIASIVIVLLEASLLGLILGILLCTLSRSKNMLLALINIVINVLAMLGGLYWALDYMPNYMLVIAKGTPTYWLKVTMNEVLDGKVVFAIFSSYVGLAFILAIFLFTLLMNKWLRRRDA